MDMEITCSGVNWVSQAQAEYLAGGLSGACKEQVEGDHKPLSHIAISPSYLKG